MNSIDERIDRWEKRMASLNESEKEVKETAERLGFNWDDAIFESVDYQYN